MTDSGKDSSLFRKDGLFQDDVREQNFMKEQYSMHLKRLRVFAVLTGSAYMFGLFSDYSCLATAPEFYVMLSLRAAVLIAAIITFISTFSKNDITPNKKIMFIYYAVISSSECIELLLKPQLATQQVPFLTFIMIWAYIIFPMRPFLMVAGGLYGSVFYSIVLFFLLGQDPQTVYVPVINFLLVNLLGFYIVRSVNLAKRREALAVDRLVDLNRQLASEIIERKNAEEKLLELAITDSLTGIFNRRHFSDLAEKEIYRANRCGRPLSFMFMDIDHFKDVNDRYGHDVGDTVLVKFAGVCSSSIRALDIFGRFGGEEFAILLPECSLKNTEMMANRMRKMIENMAFDTAEKEFGITVSIGVSAINGADITDLDTLIKNADIALYDAKKNGRNRVSVWTPEM